MFFNEKQLEAISHRENPCMVIASAGAGKSSVTIERIRQMVDEGVQPNQIVAITFTRNSAEDLKKKLKKVKVDGVVCGTFHSICAKILINEGYDLSVKIYEYELENLFSDVVGDKPNVAEIMGYIGFQKSHMLKPTDKMMEKYSEYYSGEDLKRYFKMYEEFKTKKGAWDFDDYLIEGLKVLKDNPNKYTCDYIMVDECQDCNLIQFQITDLLCPSGNIFVVGDEKQSIYGFRGAKPELFLNFDKTHKNTKVIHMNMNYRSTNSVVEGANCFIREYNKNNRHYVDAESFDRSNGEIRSFKSSDYIEEGELIANAIEYKVDVNEVDPNNIAVLYRNNAMADFLEKELRERGIPYYIENGGGFFKRKEIVGILSVLRLVINNNDNVAFEEVFRSRFYPFTFLPNSLLATMKAYANHNNISLLKASKSINTHNRNHAQALYTFSSFMDILSVKNAVGEDLVDIIDDIIDSMSIENIINKNAKTVEEENEKLRSLEILKDMADGYSLKGFIDLAYNPPKRKKKAKDGVKLMTIHGSKGLEFDDVYVVGLGENFPSTKEGVSIDEEARLMYVAVTRAKKNLYISSVGHESVFDFEYFGRLKF